MCELCGITLKEIKRKTETKNKMLQYIKTEIYGLTEDQIRKRLSVTDFEIKGISLWPPPVKSTERTKATFTLSNQETQPPTFINVGPAQNLHFQIQQPEVPSATKAKSSPTSWIIATFNHKFAVQDRYGKGFLCHHGCILLLDALLIEEDSRISIVLPHVNRRITGDQWYMSNKCDLRNLFLDQRTINHFCECMDNRLEGKDINLKEYISFNNGLDVPFKESIKDLF